MDLKTSHTHCIVAAGLYGSSHMPADALPDEDLHGTTNLEPGSGLQSASTHGRNKPHSAKEELQVVILQTHIFF
jgi:hypothetical protein